MKAAIYQGIEDIVISDVDRPSTPSDGFLIKVMACGICGSDLRTYYSGTSYIVPPVILGHEISGVIVEAGADATSKYKVGDRVAIAAPVHCGECYYCRRGLQNLCLNMEAIASAQYPGGFAQFISLDGIFIRNGCFTKIPDNLSFEEAGISELACSVIRCHEHYNTNLNDSVVIMGCGPIGCLHAQLARLRGAHCIIHADINQSRLDMARPFGADFFVNNATENLKEIVMRETDGLGATMVIIAAPNPKATDEAMEIIAKGGQLVIFAGFPKNNSILSLDGNRIHYGEISVVGTAGYTRRHQQQAIELASKCKLDLKSLITDTISLDHIEDGIRSMKSGKELKVVVQPWKE